MSEARPWLWPLLQDLHAETQIYTQRQKNTSAPAEGKFTVNDLASFLESNYKFIRVYNPGSTYRSDDLAAAAGVPLEGAYELAIDNIYGIPTGNGGITKIRKE